MHHHRRATDPAPRMAAQLDRPDSRAEPIVIGNERLTVEIAPDDGGRVVQITADGVDLLIGRGEGPDPGSVFAWGSYPMVPWAGRIRRGRFSFDGTEHSLPINFGDHAIHGVGYARPMDRHAPTSDSTSSSSCHSPATDVAVRRRGTPADPRRRSDRCAASCPSPPPHRRCPSRSGGTRGSASPIESTSHRRRCTDATTTTSPSTSWSTCHRRTMGRLLRQHRTGRAHDRRRRRGC